MGWLLRTFLLLFALASAAPFWQDDHTCISEPTERELFTARLLQREVPETTRTFLGWRTADDILASLRHEVRYLQWADFFCGYGNMGVSCSHALGSRGVWVDLTLGGLSHNIIGDAGFAHAITIVLRMEKWGFTSWGPPCSNFVWLSKGVTHRSRDQPLGDENVLSVRQNNAIVRRATLLLKLCTLREIQWIPEQPLTSILFLLPFLASFLSLRPSFGPWKLQRRCIWMGAFGHCLPKPSILVGISAVMDTSVLQHKRPKRLGAVEAIKHTTPKVITLRNGKRKSVFRCYGVKKVLKASQMYPFLFTDSVARVIAQHRRKRQLW